MIVDSGSKEGRTVRSGQEHAGIIRLRKLSLLQHPSSVRMVRARASPAWKVKCRQKIKERRCTMRAWTAATRSRDAPDDCIRRDTSRASIAEESHFDRTPLSLVNVWCAFLWILYPLFWGKP